MQTVVPHRHEAEIIAALSEDECIVAWTCYDLRWWRRPERVREVLRMQGDSYGYRHDGSLVCERQTSRPS